MLKRIVQNKYKLMAFIMGLYLLIDVLQHKGQTRMLFPGSFPVQNFDSVKPPGNNGFIVHAKQWKKGINSRDQLNEMSQTTAGFEVDIYFDTARKKFDVHHDAGTSSGFKLDELLSIYKQRKLEAGIWLDIKNLDDQNSAACLASLLAFRKLYGLQNKLIIESSRAELLSAFTDSLFFTSYYIPMFNPYRMKDAEIRTKAVQIATVLNRSRVNALSGYYFQYRFLNYYFPRYPVLTWADKNRFSLVNLAFRKKIESGKAVLGILYP